MDLKQDAVRKCEPIGPFRMMARDQNKIELVPATGMIVMLFEDVSHGVMRTIHMNRGHLAKMDPLWFGDSVGKLERRHPGGGYDGLQRQNVAQRKGRAAQSNT